MWSQRTQSLEFTFYKFVSAATTVHVVQLMFCWWLAVWLVRVVEVDHIEIGFWSQKVIIQSVTPTQRLRKSCMIRCLICCMTGCMRNPGSGGRSIMSLYSFNVQGYVFLSDRAMTQFLEFQRQFSINFLLNVFILNFIDTADKLLSKLFRVL